MIYVYLIFSCFVIEFIGITFVTERTNRLWTPEEEELYYNLFILFTFGFGMLLPVILMICGLLHYIGGIL